MTRAYLGLGSNLGDRRALLAAAIEALDWGDVRVVQRSSIYETEPVGGPADQPWFLNMVIGVDTSLSPHQLWERCAGVEIALGRAHGRGERWGPRTIDVDVLLYGTSVINDEDLTIPHPRMHERAFALVPLAEIAPDTGIGDLGSVGELIAGLSSRWAVRKASGASG